MTGTCGSLPSARIRVFQKRATHEEAAGQGELPSLREFIVALKEPVFVDKSSGSWYWLRDAHLPPEGYSRIDYSTGSLGRVSDTGFYALPFDERAFVAGGKAGGHPAVFIFGNYDDGRIAVDSFPDPRFSGRLALVSHSS